MAGLDVTPGVPSGSQIIQAYGEGRFRIGGVVHEGSVIIRPLTTRLWPVQGPQNIVGEQLLALLDGGDGIDILVVGCGKQFAPPPPDLRALLRKIGIGIEWMDTGAACRTFNVLVIEGRPVAAALIAVD
jgi:uncharacterized protein